MKTTRLISLLLASLAITSSGFAADAATAISLKGQARAKKADQTHTNIVVGSTIPNDTFVQVGAKSTLGLKTADNGTLFFGPNSAFRLRHKPEAGNGHMDVTVLSGTVAGDFQTGANGSSVIRTSGGVINTNGASAHVTVNPNATGGSAMTIVVTSGTVSVAGPNGPVTVATGQAYSPATGVVAATPAQMATATNAVSGNIAPDAAPAGGSQPGATGESGDAGESGEKSEAAKGESTPESSAPAATPNLAITADQEKREEERTLLSPNGEGNL